MKRYLFLICCIVFIFFNCATNSDVNMENAALLAQSEALYAKSEALFTKSEALLAQSEALYTKSEALLAQSEAMLAQSKASVQSKTPVQSEAQLTKSEVPTQSNVQSAEKKVSETQSVQIKTNLIIAVKESDINLVNSMLSRSLDNINNKDASGKTALMYAVENQDTAMVKLLLDKASAALDIDIVNNNGMTALLIALEKRNIQIVELLLRNSKLDINYQTPGEKNTALHYAVQSRNDKLVEMILNYRGTNQSLTNSNGETAFFIAVKQGNSNVIRMFGNLPGFDVAARPGRSALVQIPPLLWAIENSANISTIKEILNIRGAIESVDEDGNGPEEYLEASRYNPRTKAEIKDLIDEARNRSKLRRGY